MRIIGNINLFDKEQQIFVVNENGEIALFRETSMYNFCDEIADACNSLGVTSVILYGAGKQYTEALAEDLKMTINTKFGERDIEIEVIER